MNSKFTYFLVIASAIIVSGCAKDTFSEKDAVAAQMELLNLKYQHEIELETLKQKGATALQQLINTATLQQLKLTDSLTQKNIVAERKRDYSVTVVDVVTNAPISNADVTVSSEGKIYSAKTNEQGIATFSSLYLFPTTPFLISKTGYAATQILQQNLLLGTAKLWNTAELTNEVTGTLYIETDLTNATPEKVGANVLVTASASIPNSPSGAYTVYFPTYTTASGTYSIKVPVAPNGYTLAFEQVTADQKLIVNATEDDAVQSFPSSLPRVATIKTYFGVNRFSAPVPSQVNSYYFKFSPDKTGKVLYLPGYYAYYGYNQIQLTAVDNKYQVERLNVTSPYNNNGTYIDFNAFNYDPNTKIDVELVDVVGNLIESAPKLAATTSVNGKILYTNSPEGGNGYVHLKRTDAGVLVADAKGKILKAVNYDSFSNLYSLNFNSLNTVTSMSVNNSLLISNKGDKRVINFYYGAGESRVKQVY
jgi:hypothetical protein